MRMKRRLIRESGRSRRRPRALLGPARAEVKVNQSASSRGRAFNIELYRGWLEVSIRKLAGLSRQLLHRPQAFRAILHAMTYAPMAIVLLALL
jgi:hypothetical protein